MTLPKSVGGRYELGELLGYGGMAEVHKGNDVRLGRDVAVKVLRADLARDPSFQNRFRREAQAAAGLNHPAIVAVYDTGEDRSVVAGEDVVSPFIVMEYVEGRTLRDILKSEGQLPVRRAEEIVSEVCSALDFSHRSGIVHRDIKPGNVMITKAGAVKVMDFGIARALADNAATVTATAAVIGTAQYLSPEQARGESVDARSDVYSTGCLLYELVTGHPPFTGDSPVAVAYQHVRENPRIPSTVSPAVPRELDSIIMKALAKNPLNRYQTAAEMRTDLQRAIAGQRVEAEAVMTDAERTQFIAPAAGAAGPLLPRPGVLDAVEVEDDTRGRRGVIIWAFVVVALLAAIGITGYAVLHNSSKASSTVTVGAYVGQDPKAAQDAIRGAGLVPNPKLGTTSGPCTSGAAGATAIAGVVGQVCTQDPAAGSELKKGQTVTLNTYVVPTVVMPNVVNLDLAQAQQLLTDKGLIVLPAQTVHNSAAANQVVTQDPAAGKAVAAGAKVQLRVADHTSKLPDETKKPFDVARADLNSLGWVNVAPGTEPVKPGFKVGDVQSMTPNSGNWYDQSATITLNVATAPVVTTPACTTAPPTTPGVSGTAGVTSSASATATATTSATSTTSAGSIPTPTCSAR